ncbi:DUF5049 domain-containing protein [Ferviditalea candida]|uniref:DUF5049 domain-containing protein n=1 Tax=Ferviditalea candida TaxID=3108399 RepID=A0ABU5ZNL6_9BACL|nr:DUF5049 domain-containing protein [Paenibacillaceae bacterium T2]
MVKVTKNVLDGLEAVRSSGMVNMLDTSGVIRCAEKLGFAETANWIRENKDAYWDGVFVGFESGS